LKRVIAISLLTIFLSGQVNLTWATHFCGSLVVESAVSLGKADLSCGMQMMSCCDEDSDENSGPFFTNEECCSNDYASSEADDFFDKSSNSNDKQALFVNAFLISILSFTQENDEQTIFDDSSPPLIQVDRQVLYQTFLL
jgi:hypothetical protein